MADPPLMTVKEAAQYCRVSPAFFYVKNPKSPRPPHIRIGKKMMFRRDHLDDWLLQQTVIP